MGHFLVEVVPEDPQHPKSPVPQESIKPALSGKFNRKGGPRGRPGRPKGSGKKKVEPLVVVEPVPAPVVADEPLIPRYKILKSPAMNGVRMLELERHVRAGAQALQLIADVTSTFGKEVTSNARDACSHCTPLVVCRYHNLLLVLTGRVRTLPETFRPKQCPFCGSPMQPISLYHDQCMGAMCARISVPSAFTP